MFSNRSARTSGHPIDHLAAALGERARQRKHRRQYRRMLDYDDHILRDIGISRDDIQSELARSA